MSGGQIHFEVFARRHGGGSLQLEMATEDRARAMAYAEELLEGGASQVKVNKEVMDPFTGEYAGVTILTRGAAAKATPKTTIEDAGPACVAPNDLYSSHSRQRIVRLLDGWLGRNKATPFELLHRPDLAEKLEASGTDLQHAVQKIAIPEAHARGVSVHEVIRTFNSLIERTIERLIRDGRKGAFANFKTEPFNVACQRLLDNPEAHYRLGGGVAASMADCRTWAQKIDRLLDLADSAPADPRPRALAFEVLEQPLGEILGTRAGVAELLGPDLDLGGSLAALTRLTAGPSVEMLSKIDPAIARVMPPLEGSALRLSRWMEGAYFQAVRAAIGKRVISDIKSSMRLRPADAHAEIDILRALAMGLTAAAGKLLSADDIRDAFIERSHMLISADFVTAALAGAKTPSDEVRALLRLAENVTGPVNKSQAAQWLIGALAAVRFEREMRNAAEPPMNRMAILAELQRAIGRVDLPDADRLVLTKRLGELGGLVEQDSNLIAALMRAPMAPMQRLMHLLKMALGETAPLGPVSARAREAAIRLGRSPDLRADLAAAPEVVEKLRPLLMAG